MSHSVAIHSDEAPDRGRLFITLAGAILIASLSFALIFCSLAWLPHLTLTWLDTLPPAKAASTLRMITIFARTFSLFLGAFTSVFLLAIVARKQRSRQRHPIKSI